jgi:hypothetical protein
MTVCGMYRNNSTKYFLKGKMFQHRAWTKLASLAVTIRFQGAIAAQVYLDQSNFVKNRVFILQMNVVRLLSSG